MKNYNEVKEAGLLALAKLVFSFLKDTEDDLKTWIDLGGFDDCMYGAYNNAGSYTEGSQFELSRFVTKSGHCELFDVDDDDLLAYFDEDVEATKEYLDICHGKLLFDDDGNIIRD